MSDNIFEPGKKGRVTQAYQAQYVDALAMFAGEKLICGRRDPENPGWAWCTSWQGKAGWVPESYLIIDGESGVAKRDYNARELSVIPGDLLTLRELESGWYWASDKSGKDGWVPARVVEVLEES